MTDRTFRTERDTMGEVQVPADALWGAQSQRSLSNFRIGEEKMPKPIVRALGLVKRASAEANMELGRLDPAIGKAIVQAAQEVIEGKLDAHFPLAVWQTGSGTQSNMNANEVISNRAIELLGGVMGSKKPVHPNDHVNMSQSSNDTYPTAMHIAAAEQIVHDLIPALTHLRDALAAKQREFQNIIKIGRTHTQDATPLTLGQEFSGYVAQLDHALRHVEAALPHLQELALGGTAVGTGLNAHPEYAERVAKKLAELTGHPFVTAPNKFEALAAKDAFVFAHGALKTLAASLTKIANDVRWLASGPRCGIGELRIPENEPGSSIMPGKVNPVMAEMLNMVCHQVFGHDATVHHAVRSAQLELNVMMPVIAYNLLQSATILTNAMDAFRERAVKGLKVNEDMCRLYLERSLMLVTALTPRIGYLKAAEVAKEAMATDRTLREVLLAKKLLTAKEIDEALDPWRMLGTGA